jgi:Protein of unknown function (DUF2815)
MSTTTIAAPDTKVITGKVRFSYAHVWEAVAIEEGQPKKFSISLIIPKSDTATINKITAAIEAVKEMAKGKLGGKLPVKFKLPLRDGDADRDGDDAYAGCYFLNANSATKPGIVDAAVRPILNQDEFYSGCYGRASINFYFFDTKGNKGIAVGLNNVQKLEDGPALSGRSKPEDDFGADFAGENVDDIL